MPQFFSLVTVVSGILLVISALLYAFSAFRGEEGKGAYGGHEDIASDDDFFIPEEAIDESKLAN